MKYLKKINEFNENEFEMENEFRLGHDEEEGDVNYNNNFYSTDEEEGDEDFYPEDENGTLYDKEDFYSNDEYSDDEYSDDEYSDDEDEDSDDKDEFYPEDENEFPTRDWNDNAQLERISSFNSFNEKMNPGFKAYLKKKAEEAGKKAPAKKAPAKKAPAKKAPAKNGKKVEMPDFPDVDKDGDKEESIKKAAADKKAAARKAPARKAPVKKK